VQAGVEGEHEIEQSVMFGGDPVDRVGLVVVDHRDAGRPVLPDRLGRPRHQPRHVVDDHDIRVVGLHRPLVAIETVDLDVDQIDVVAAADQAGVASAEVVDPAAFAVGVVDVQDVDHAPMTRNSGHGTMNCPPPSR
jgi:hypothetical protein